MDTKAKSVIHCRVCGSLKLNKLYYALDLGKKLLIHQVFDTDSSIDKLIRPCECRGEFAFVHRVCLEEWIETTKHQYCDICSFKYNLIYVDRPITEWFLDEHRVRVVSKVACLTLLVYYVSLLGILTCWTKIHKSVLDIVVLCSSYFWLISCTLTLVVLTYKSYSELKFWRDTNKRVFVEENKSPQLELQCSLKDVLKSSGFRPSV